MRTVVNFLAKKEQDKISDTKIITRLLNGVTSDFKEDVVDIRKMMMRGNTVSFDNVLEEFSIRALMLRRGGGAKANRVGSSGQRRDQRPKKTCRDFNSRKGCSYGDRCKFAHVKDRAGAGGECFNFRDNGKCRFGDSCRFSHAAKANATSTKAQAPAPVVDEGADLPF